jgi:Conjugative transposon protein TcpC
MSGETMPPGRASVTVTSHALWRLRLVRDVPRYLIVAVSLTGLLASVRLTLAPPHPRALAAAGPPAPSVDPAAEGYATLFARRYLSWNAAEPQAAGRTLEAFVGSGMEAAAGLTAPASGEQHVEWAEVVQVRNAAGGERVYTVAAQTDTAGLLYLTVGVARTAGGSLAIAGYPALVGAPAAAPALPARRLREVGEPALATVVERALRNYLADSPGELEADLAAGARVSLPGLRLRLESIGRLDWTPDGRSVAAVVHAQDARGVRYTLAYEVDVVRKQGRWEVAAVQMDPDA